MPPGSEYAVILLAIPLTYLLIRYRGKRARDYMERHFQEVGEKAEVEKVGFPPLRLWFNNRKGDAWCLVRYADHSTKWARVGFRRRFIGGKVPIEFFD
jgi:hypothetical protein